MRAFITLYYHLYCGCSSLYGSLSLGLSAQVIDMVKEETVSTKARGRGAGQLLPKIIHQNSIKSASTHVNNNNNNTII